MSNNSSFLLMKKRKLKKKPLLILASILILIPIIIYNYNLSSVSNKKEEVVFIVEEGDTYSSLSSTLKQVNMIKSEFFYKVYIKIHNPKNLQAGTYYLNKNMNVKKIVQTLNKGPHSSGKYINITFKEGINMRRIVKLISDNTNISEEEIYKTLKDETYLNKIIEKYWFLDDTIKNNKIYYSLEGYLFPDTYEVNVNGNITDIFGVMLDNMEKKLEPYKETILNSKYTVHEILTLASIVEMEAANSDDRAGVAGVFINRLNNGWSLGSDVTTYYGIKVDVSERDLYQSEIDTYNDYNTRHAKMAGKLPIGPICIPSIDSLKAAINPTNHNYYYFVADKNKKTYFFKNYNEHINKISELKRNGLWYEY